MRISDWSSDVCSSDLFIQRRLFLEDPILRASLTTNLGFSWEDVTDLISISPSQRRILEAARREGLKSGFTVPANIPGEAHGSCSFACAKDRAFPTEYLDRKSTRLNSSH